MLSWRRAVILIVACVVAGCNADVPDGTPELRNLFGDAIRLESARQKPVEQITTELLLQKFPPGTAVASLVAFIESEGGHCLASDGGLGGHSRDAVRCNYRHDEYGFTYPKTLALYLKPNLWLSTVTWNITVEHTFALIGEILVAYDRRHQRPTIEEYIEGRARQLDSNSQR